MEIVKHSLVIGLDGQALDDHFGLFLILLRWWFHLAKSYQDSLLFGQPLAAQHGGKSNACHGFAISTIQCALYGGVQTVVFHLLNVDCILKRVHFFFHFIV